MNAVASTPASQQPAALQLQGLSKRYGGKLAVDAVTLSFEPGAFIGRYTHQETSHSNFIYPRQLNSTVGNPMDQNVNVQLNTSGAEGIVRALYLLR